MTSEENSDHWLVRGRTIRSLWIVFAVVLAVTVALQLVIDVKGYFGVDDWFAFGAAFGFFSCFAMVLIAKGLGWLLKREEGFYGD